MSLTPKVREFVEFAEASFQPMVVNKYVNAPNTQIVNRAQVLDATNSLKSVIGVERIMFEALAPVFTERGPADEPVYRLNGGESRIRFVGHWSHYTSTSGTYVGADADNDTAKFMEVTFYGTGLNVLYTPFATRDLRVTIDGGAESANILLSYNAFQTGSNYGVNTVVKAASGLALGWHTVKLRRGSTSLAGFYGVEIINSRTSILHTAGTAFNTAYKYELAAPTTTAYNTGVTGVKGARVVKYLNDGAVSQAITEVGVTPTFWPATITHSNEEVYRRISWREFGAQSSSDFSTITTSGSFRRFTLADGTTTLVCDSADYPGSGTYYGASNADLLRQGNTQQIILTFIGTGLDVQIHTDASTRNWTSVTVDGGASIGAPSYGPNLSKIVPICSNLPYGTHVVVFTGGAVANLAISNFIIYQPKKPAIPEGTVELADYNIMADHVFNTGNITARTISDGVLRKHAFREFAFVGGSWQFNTNVVSIIGGGEQLQGAGGAGHYYEFNFFGTGFEVRQVTNTTPCTAEFRLNGQLLTSTNFPGVTTQGTDQVSLNLTTGIADLETNNGTYLNGGIVVKNLPLGHYTFRLTGTGGGDQLRVSSIDVITPIHVIDKNLKTGSLSISNPLGDSAIKKNEDKVADRGLAKAWMAYNGTFNTVTGGHNIAGAMIVATGILIVWFKTPFKDTNYSCVFSGGSAEVEYIAPFSGAPVKTAQYVCIAMRGSGGTLSTAVNLEMVAFGELQGE